MSPTRRAVTLVEVVVAAGLLTVVFGIVYQLVFGLLGSRKTSAVRLTGASFLRQDARIALEKLIERIEHGIEVLEPAAGKSGPSLEFRDLLNHRIKLAVDPQGRLASSRMESGTAVPETAAAILTTASGKRFTPAPVVEIRQCLRAVFHAASPSQVLVELTLADAGRSVTVVAGVRLRNGGLIDE